ncbi:MAG: hypothetical protein L5656_04550 [Thermanaeromonas sp.]|uniref:hypothetical protein n=1 Tax=Thermanaeromonas sp. TaxID=2003697 RepID=UPI00243DAD55|nr:hypothetical protein [Thermanaeromonas sp.]MCG0277784.1 hypothetical protein [Thermanaeromonas sp.]
MKAWVDLKRNKLITQETKNTVRVANLETGYEFTIEREGVFVHSFICQHCGLHFLVFSWQSNRHRVDNTYCPECGKQGAFLHWKHMLSDNKEFNPLSEGGEIFNYVPFMEGPPERDSVWRKSETELVKLYDEEG